MEAARELGVLIAGRGMNLVYGGAQIGLMGAVADAALEAGGTVTGVIPEHLKTRELVHEGLSALHVTGTMQERQKMMSDLSDAFVILPGGLGTLAELFESITWKQLGLHNKPVFILNIDGYWDLLCGAIERICDEEFMHNSGSGALYEFVNEVVSLNKVL